MPELIAAPKGLQERSRASAVRRVTSDQGISRSRKCEYRSSRTTRSFASSWWKFSAGPVIHAATGEDALAWCGRRVVDVLVTDVRLPGSVDGRSPSVAASWIPSSR